jgi:hypothetical protein
VSGHVEKVVSRASLGAQVAEGEEVIRGIVNRILARSRARLVHELRSLLGPKREKAGAELDEKGVMSRAGLAAETRMDSGASAP